MITIKDVLNCENLQYAMEHLTKKNNSCGIDNVLVSEFPSFWEANKEVLIPQFLDGSYEPDIVVEKEIVRYDGKHRNISLMTCTDRFFLRAINQILQPICEQNFMECSHAYRSERSVETTVRAAANYISQGMTWVAEIDIEHFFDNISLLKMEQTIEFYIDLDDVLKTILEKYLRCRVQQDGRIVTKQVGLIQGSPLSPTLSNLYLTVLDYEMTRKEYAAVRYGDDIRIYFKSEEEAAKAVDHLTQFLANMGLSVNKDKAGVYRSINRKFLGYIFERGKNDTILARRWKDKNKHYRSWNSSSLQRIDKNYHIINNGILTKKDFSILFESENGKVHFPIEMTDSINIYSDVIVTTNILKTLANKRLRLSVFDKYGRHMGCFNAHQYGTCGTTMLKQAALYLDSERRLEMAKKLELAAVHNMRANLRYYKKQNGPILEEGIEFLSGTMSEMSEAESVKELMLIEARARQFYYKMFDIIITNPDFGFSQRTKRPPKDPLNAMISFGNVYLYNRFSTEIQKTSLDIRVGILHSTNNRAESLNLDIAELFKPIIIDRAIFTLINKRMIHVDEHFEKIGNNAVYLNDSGKRLFLEEIEKKIYQTILVGEHHRTYDYLMREEVQKILRQVLHGKPYKPYKYTT